MSIYSSAFQPQVGGVVLLICKIFANSYMAAEKVSEQILKVYFKGNPLIVMFVIYAPSNVANDSDKAAFFSDLHESPRSNLTPLSSCITQTPGRQANFALRSLFLTMTFKFFTLFFYIVSTVQNAAEEVVRKPPKRSIHHWVSARLEDLVHQ